MSHGFSSSDVSSTVGAARSAAQPTTQVSTTTLLNALHTIHASGQTYQLDASASLAINTWATAQSPNTQGNVGGVIDIDIGNRAWEHARRRAEDACIILASLHPSTPSLLITVLHSLPIAAPPILYTTLAVLRPFLHCVTPLNASTSCYSSLAVTYSTTLTGRVKSVSVSISNSGIDVYSGLLHVPNEHGYRVFDVFYYLLTSASTPAEREFLRLKKPHLYTLLNKSRTFQPPGYLPAADDTAAAEDLRANLKSIGIKGSLYRGLITTLAALLKLGDTTSGLVDSEVLEEVCEDVGTLMDLDPEILLRQSTIQDREVFIAAVYEALVHWLISRGNDAIAAALQHNGATAQSVQNEDSVNISVVEVANESLGKAIALRGVFDDQYGLNAEMIEDGIDIVPVGHSIMKEVTTSVLEVEYELSIYGRASARDREHDRDQMNNTLQHAASQADDNSFLLALARSKDAYNTSMSSQFELATVLQSSRTWYHLSLHPTDEPPSALVSLNSTTSAWSAAAVSRQLRAWRLPEWVNRRNKNIDFTVDFDVEEFVVRYSRLGCQEGRDGIETFLLERGWTNGEVVIGRERIWMRESVWWEAESILDVKAAHAMRRKSTPTQGRSNSPNPFAGGYTDSPPYNDSGLFKPLEGGLNVTTDHQSVYRTGNRNGSGSIRPGTVDFAQKRGGDYGLGPGGDNEIIYQDGIVYEDGFGRFTENIDPEFADSKRIEARKRSAGRIAWISWVWLLTWPIPSTVLRNIGRMKRPDVRMAWREKVVLVFFIFLLNAAVVFYIIEFGRLLCPNFDKAWNAKEVSYHQGDNDFYVSIHGRVYDISTFWKTPHSQVAGLQTTPETMQPFAGLNLDVYFEPPLSRACKGLKVVDTIQLQHNNTDAIVYPSALHTSGPRFQTNPTTALYSWNWYFDIFAPKIAQYYKGDLVVAKNDIYNQGQNQQRYWVIIDQGIYDLTDYFYTLGIEGNYFTFKFFPDEVTSLFQNYPGQDISTLWGDTDAFTNSMECLQNAFYQGKVDYRLYPKCQVNNYLLLAFTIILCSVILTKFLASLQLGSKRRPAPQDKFVICLVPAYTEGEDQLRKSLDSLTSLQYDNKRKLICVVCDGNITGGGNDRPTPKIVLDILGVDPKVDPPALPFRSVGMESEQLNYGKVYSGLYEYEGNVVPYVVIVKVGKESEQSSSKPGNRGKRDSQILLMQFLNRVHFRAPMSPLELELFHQINNIIGVDPELYEYLFMLDADTMVREDSLNRLVASCVNNVKIAGICGETSLENEEKSWWTMIQIYEYYISHHLAKSFESLFGSVTCLPGCFCMYRLRTADKGKPLIIANEVIREYAEGDVDTLHKKNLLALGEDRYLTTLMSKHFSNMSYKFVPDAYALTAAPDSWSVLLSQRRRWINSTLHNLAELVLLKDLCGFCCFSMRFVVFIDLMGTLILPATCVYLGYLIYRVSSHTGQFPLISLIMIACVYGLQAVVFLIRRQWQHIGWMIFYILAFPIYSFILPIYSFWNQDNFSWGNTRIVLEEKGAKKLVAVQDDVYDPRSIPLQRWDDYARVMKLPGRRGDLEADAQEKNPADVYEDERGFEMDDMRSMYSSVHPASTIMTGSPMQQYNAHPFYMAPSATTMPFGGIMTNPNRASTMTGLSMYRDQPMSIPGRHMSNMSIGNRGSGSPYQDSPHSPYQSGMGLPYSNSRQSLLRGGSRPTSAIDFRSPISTGPSYEAIVRAIRDVLSEVDLDSVTKKQVKALVSQRLRNEITGEKRTFLDHTIDDELANM